ncbi:prepilin-type N-terminal cleavage/methylation domain-containing protein [Pseudofulvibacter geojedonensis]|uniref:Prepilin-type N-terminal cleavage/methylation domain-containing protein n=1 Tax=Pseudofulvibacter geojedonensis TaxID=1123758 RepID=A0ABW3I1V6_9FLAO
MIKKVNAYTLSEVLVVLLLTSIIAGIAFSVLGMVQKQLFSVQKNMDIKASFRQLEQSLLIDFNKYQNVKFNDLENKLICYSEIDSVVYNFNPKYVQKDLDTFYISGVYKKMFFSGKKVNEGLIDAIKIDSIEANPNLQLFIFKQNDANTYLD